MANDENKKVLTQEGNNGVPGEDAGNPKPPEDQKNEPKNENGFVKACKWTWSKAKSAGRFLWKHKGKVVAIFGTGVVTGVVISNMAHSGGSSEVGVGNVDMLNAGVDIDTGLMPDVNSSVDVDVDVPDLVNVSDYMEDTDV